MLTVSTRVDWRRGDAHSVALYSGNSLTRLIYSTLVTGRPAHSAAISLSGPKNGVFAPQERHVAPINVKFGTQVRSPVPNFTFIGAKMWKYSPKLSKFRILARNLYLRGDSFAIFLRNSQRLYASR